MRRVVTQGDVHWISQIAKQGGVLYMNSKKASGLSRAARVSVPAVSKVRSHKPKVLSERDLVKGCRATPEFYQTDQTGDGRVYFQGETPRGIAWTVLSEEVNSFTAEVRRAAAFLADPVFVLKSGTVDGALDDVDSKGDFLVAAIHPAQGTVTFHGLKSLYGKEKTPADPGAKGAAHWISEIAKQGGVLYMNSKKASGLSRAARVNIPAVSKVRSHNQKVLSERDLVKGRRVTPEFYQTDQTGKGHELVFQQEVSSSYEKSILHWRRQVTAIRHDVQI